MMTMPEWLKRAFYQHNLRQRFPTSVIHCGATLDQFSALGEFSVLFRDTTLVKTNLGSYSYIQSGTVIYNAEIGPFCSIAGDVIIGLAAHPTSMVSTSPVFYDNAQPLPRFFAKDRQFTQTLPKTIVGADVWIGQGAMVKAGIQIGVGAVIGAGAMVTKDISPYVIAAGNPCRPIRHRFSESTCQRLLDSRWWELSEEKLTEFASLFSDPESFLTALHLNKE